jgi:Flp pilus assembly protein protease CpaA
VIVLLILISLFIVLQDIQDHIISNRALLVLAIPLFIMHEEVMFTYSLVASLLLLALAIPTALGGGDIKLLLLLFWSSPHSIFSLRYLAILMLILLVQLIRLVGVQARTGWRNTHIPLAPALLLPILGIRLGL